MSVDAMRSFVDVVETGGFTQAAERGRVAKSVVSRRVKALEDKLGTHLLNRSTRAVSLTEFGEHYYHEARDILTRFDALHNEGQCVTKAVAGALKITLPQPFDALGLDRLLDEFMRAYPDVLISVTASDRRTDLVANGIDAALRIGRLDDSALIGKRIGEVGFAAAAAPDYLAKHGTPTHPDDLKNHAILGYSGSTLGIEYQFSGPDGPIRRRLNPAFNADNGQLLKAMAEKGHGVVMLPYFLLRESIKSRHLVRILDGFTSDASPVHILFQQSRNQPAALRAFIDFVAAEMPKLLREYG